MMTCGSERSGIASRGTFLMDQTPITTSDKTRATTSPRWVAQYSIIALIMLSSSTGGNSCLRRPERLAALLHCDRRLPGPGHRNIYRPRILAVARRLERRLRSHWGPAPHLRHKERHFHFGVVHGIARGVFDIETNCVLPHFGGFRFHYFNSQFGRR